MALTLNDIVPVSIDAAQLATSTASIYASPAGEGGSKINSLYIINDTTTAVVATIYNVPSGGAADDTNIVIKGVTVPGDGIPLWVATENTPLWVEAAGTIRGSASAATQVTIQGGGLEYKI